MKKELMSDQEFWEIVIENLAITPELREYIERQAAKGGEQPWAYILRVLYREFDREREGQQG